MPSLYWIGEEFPTVLLAQADQVPNLRAAATPASNFPEPAQVLVDWLALGGPVVWILIGLATIALAIVLLKSWQFMVVGVGRSKSVERALDHWRGDNADEVLKHLAGKQDPVAIVVGKALTGLKNGFDHDSVREECQRLGNAQLERLQLLLRPLAFIGTTAPLLGLLGTVIGMIAAFQGIEQAGTQVDPTVLSGGIWAALLTTAVGLTVAIPVTMAHSWLERRLERLAHRIEDAVAVVFTARLMSAGSQLGNAKLTDQAAGESQPARGVIGVVKPAGARGAASA